VKPVRVAVVGVGHMGTFHTEKVRALAARGEAVELVGVADRDADRVAEVSRRLGVPGSSDSSGLFERADAAIVAVPTAHHFEVVGAALAAGLDVLVEKPIAASLEEAEALLEQARRGGRVLQVGHLEWYNSAMRAIAPRLDRPRFVEAHRLGPFRGRATDVDVVRDLMIHDIDIVQRLVGAEPERVEAIGVAILSPETDIANARLVFPGGCVANLTASRVSAQPLRKLRFFQPDGYFSIDFLEQTVVVWRRLSGGAEMRIEREELKIDRGDALESQLCAYFEAIRTRRVQPGSGSEALAALRTALRVVDAMPPADALR
jgi:predicted dehydrogenase